MQLINQTRQTVIATNIERADNILTRFKGLMGRPQIADNYALWIVPCFDIHSCFMRFEFDAIFLNKELKVLHLVERMKPWRVSKLVRGGHVVVELPAGAIQRTQTQLSDLLAWKDAL